MTVAPLVAIVGPAVSAMMPSDGALDVRVIDLGPDTVLTLEELDPRAVLVHLEPEACGLQILREARKRLALAAFGVIAADGSALARALMAGADAGLAVPFEAEAHAALVANVLRRAALASDAARFRRRAEGVLSVTSVESIIGTHPVMQQVLKRVTQVAQSRSTVLIQGESGTGKELIAAAIHQNSKRREGPLVRLNCAALSESVLESELFGHERGAFTGALQRREGRFKQADGGTLFLDEVGEIPSPVQVKLLRFLQEREFERVGSNESLRVDVRVVAATNKDLRALVEDGRFREDLYYRLSVVQLVVPPLRARPSDVLLLAEHFLRCLAAEEGVEMEGFTAAAKAALLAYPWPGNVRELRNCVEQAFVFAEGALLDVQDLPIATSVPKREALRLIIPGATMAEIERYAILETLRSVGGSTTRAAAILGISQRTIQYRIKEWDLGGKATDGSTDRPGTPEESPRPAEAGPSSPSR
ncbi:MAG: sigma-54-dependent Fis family transcriptional regulator [Polyangiaceae bacterium]|nr:sigma-54-dependent Fis family transcriptional regulator [Polyangiaceae bacterium]